MTNALDAAVISTVAAATISGLTLMARELVCRLGARRDLRHKLDAAGEKSRGELAVRQGEMLLQQIQLLWAENAALKTREAECEVRYRDLERRCRELEARCEALSRRIDRAMSPAESAA